MEDVRFAELIAGIAHELRSPLTSVKGFSSTLIKKWDRFSDEQRYQFVETIHSDAERMARIVSEVVDLARLEAGRLELYPQDADITEAAGRAVTELAEVPGVERVVVEVPPGCHAWVDPARLQRMIFNLVENAIKYSDAGPVTVQAAPSDGAVDLVVSDDGVGIEATRMPGLFDGPGPSGQRVAPSGTGLGLLLTKKLAEAQGGRVSVQSRAPHGSSFTVRLPSQAPDVDLD
jgi:signal transduction histidine kinase